MHLPTQDLLGTVADQFASSPVDECAVSLQIDAVNALTGGVEQHLHLFRDAISLLLRPLALRNVFGKRGYVLRLSRGIPEQRKPPIRNDHAAVSANEALFPFVIVMLSLDEIRISFRSESTFIRVNDLVPFFKVAQLFRGITQHLVQCAVRKNRAAIDIEEADPDLGILEDRAEELLARLHAIFDILVHGLTPEPC